MAYKRLTSGIHGEEQTHKIIITCFTWLLNPPVLFIVWHNFSHLTSLNNVDCLLVLFVFALDDQLTESTRINKDF